MTAISELAAPGTITGLERIPGLQGTANAGIPLFALGGAPSGTVLALARPFLADTAATSDADPGAGNVRWNHATQASATVIYVDDVDTAAADIAAVLAALTIGGFLYLQQPDPAGAGIWQKWQVTSVTDATGYTKLGVTLQASQGSFADDADVLLSVQQPATAGGGTTAGKHAIPVMAGAIAPSVSGGCAALSSIVSAANQPDIVTLDFDATTQEYAQFAIPMPKSWNEGTITAQFRWSHASTATNFGVVWNIQAVAVSDDDAIAVAFGTAQQIADTGGTTNDLYITAETPAITVAGTPSAGDTVFVRVSRVTGDASDTMAIDARLHSVVLFITTDADTDA